MSCSLRSPHSPTSSLFRCLVSKAFAWLNPASTISEFGKADRNPRRVSKSFVYILVAKSLLHKVQSPLLANNDLVSKYIRSPNSCTPRFGSRFVNLIAHSNGEITLSGTSISYKSRKRGCYSSSKFSWWSMWIGKSFSDTLIWGCRSSNAKLENIQVCRDLENICLLEAFPEIPTKLYVHDSLLHYFLVISPGLHSASCIN